jgi:hypothetical protein
MEILMTMNSGCGLRDTQVSIANQLALSAVRALAQGLESHG